MIDFAELDDHAVLGVGVRPLACWDYGFNIQKFYMVLTLPSCVLFTDLKTATLALHISRMVFNNRGGLFTARYALSPIQSRHVESLVG
jgi:hypothetical protein